MKKHNSAIIGIPSKIITGGNEYYTRISAILPSEFQKLYFDSTVKYKRSNSIKLILNIIKKKPKVLISPSTLLIENLVFSLIWRRNFEKIIVLQEEDWKFGFKPTIKKNLYNFLLKRADRIIVCSEKLSDKLSGNFRIDDKKIKVVNPPLLTENSALTQNPTYDYKTTDQTDKIQILCVSRIEERKQIHTLIDLLRKLEKPFNLKIAGKYDEASEYVNNIFHQASSLPAESIQFLGAVTRKELSYLYHNSDLLIHPARNEAFGMVLIESLSYGCPVICQREITREIKELPGVKCFDLESDRDEVVKLIEDKSKISELKKTAQNNMAILKKNSGWEIFDQKIKSALSGFI